MIKKLRKSQKIILLIALIISFYFMIHPEYEEMRVRMWIWDEEMGGYTIIYSDIIMKISMVAVATGIVLFIESLIYSKKEEGL